MTPHDLGKVREGAVLSQILPHVDMYIREQEDKLIQNVMTRLQDGKLTPDLALYAWMELASMRKMLKSLTTKVRIGISAAERNSEELTIGGL